MKGSISKSAQTSFLGQVQPSRQTSVERPVGVIVQSPGSTLSLQSEEQSEQLAEQSDEQSEKQSVVQSVLHVSTGGHKLTSAPLSNEHPTTGEEHTTSLLHAPNTILSIDELCSSLKTLMYSGLPEKIKLVLSIFDII
jgi:hypothetical protein